MRYVTHMNGIMSHVTQKVAVRVLSPHGTHTNTSWQTYMNASRHTCECVMPRMNESCPMSRRKRHFVRTSHGTHMHELCHTAQIYI